MNTKRLINELLLVIKKKQIPLYCDPDGNPFINVPIDPQQRPWPLRSKTVRSWVYTECFQGLAFVPTPGAVDAVLNVLEGHAWKDVRNNTGPVAVTAFTADPNNSVLIEQLKQRKTN